MCPAPEIQAAAKNGEDVYQVQQDYYDTNSTEPITNRKGAVVDKRPASDNMCGIRSEGGEWVCDDCDFTTNS